MRVITIRQVRSPVPEPNSNQSSWILLEDNEKILHTDVFDGSAFLLISKITDPLDVDPDFVRDGGQLDHDHLPEWIERDENGLILRTQPEETQIMSFVRQWQAHDDVVNGRKKQVIK